MTTSAHGAITTPQPRQMLNKVPEIILYFWVIKIMATTVGETAADYLNETLGFGLTNTTYVMSVLLLIILALQFRLRKYVPAVYWLAVVFISVVGTLITDNLTDHYNVPLETTTIVFSIALAVTFAVWYASERTLSIHTIFTTRRETFYWLAILFTFALGTAAGDLTGERLNLGYWVSALMFGGMIAAVAIAHFRFGLNAVLSFWIAYILTRPLGASIGDFLSQARGDGGLALGTTGTSALFLATILSLVTYLTATRKDQAAPETVPAWARVLVVAHKTAATPALLNAVRRRTARGPVRFHLLVPNPEHASWRPAEADHPNVTEGEQVLALALPLIEEAAGSPADGSVSTRHDPMDAIEESLHGRDFDEIILSTLPRSVSRWLHIDLPSRVAHLGLPVTTVTAQERLAASAA
jgi:uncharacterized membrane-anchored protein